MLPRILVVDDEDSVRDLICHRLRNLGLTDLHQAGSGQEVIALLEAGYRYDLIISDQCMENGTGMDIICYLIKQRIQCFFLFFTSSNMIVEFSQKWFLGVVEKADIEGLELRVLRAVCGL